MFLSPKIIEQFASTGRLRASINLGNPILANRDPQSGLAFGVSVDLARQFAKFLEVDVDLVVFDSAGKSVEAVIHGAADIGFFAIDPLRGVDIGFTAPYVLIEGAYLVKAGSPIAENSQVDDSMNRVVVGKGSAYDLYLTRELRNAHIVRAPTSPTVVDLFMREGLEVAAGVRQQLEFDMQRFSGLRLLPGRFMQIQQAMGAPKSYGDEALGALDAFVAQMKSSGFIANSLRTHGVQGASVAP
ncbi:transporter substrate-binding domain-containing protein [Polynucleobacter sp. 73C-SIWE]|uniref:transporter substrate-binding domain-containing protein n=1 Tax=Polynucleobacter sp. 73C-SIWE TaxID=2689098 RepID=UPI001C0B4241|nr:transporter substrate-binding domain-containing protein [Polynucleobacter sp. 73C-SIWE]MBU3579944.1 transporter substrate-binding domain-containing protein [Polynucleobacter sp. 73C-SIWE]